MVTKLVRYIKDNWFFYLLGLLAVYFLIFEVLAGYLDKHYTKDITCTVESASTSLRSGGSGGRASSSFKSTVETKECGSLVFYSTFVKGAGMEDITNQLTEDETYIFTVNRYIFFNNRPKIQGVKNIDGTPVDFVGN